MRINELCTEAHSIARSKGFWSEPRTILGLLMLINTEVSEAAEGVRKKGVTENLSEEMADTCIRIFDLCEALSIDLEAEIKMKMLYNKQRPLRHGKHYEELRIEPKGETDE